jgi:hypothetical protein
VQGVIRDCPALISSRAAMRMVWSIRLSRCLSLDADVSQLSRDHRSTCHEQFRKAVLIQVRTRIGREDDC